MKNVSMTTLISGRRIYCISWHEKRGFHVYISGEANNLIRNSSPITGLSSAPAALRGGRRPPFKQAHSSPFFFLDVVLSRSVAHLLSRVDRASDGRTRTDCLPDPAIRACGLQRGGEARAGGAAVGGVGRVVLMSSLLIRRCIQTTEATVVTAALSLLSFPSRRRWM